MRFPFLLCGCFAAAVFLLCAAAAPAATVVAPAQFAVNADTGYCDGFNCATTYSKGLFADVPGALQAPCSAAAGAPICAGAQALATPEPYISAAATTTLNHQAQNAQDSIAVTYYYEVLCDTCAAGMLVPLTVGGTMEAHYVQGTVPPNGTVTIADFAQAWVYGYNPLTMKDDVIVDLAQVGLGANAVDLNVSGMPGVTSPPSGFGFCESTWNEFHSCTSGPSGSFGVPFEVTVNTGYSIYLNISVAVHASNQPFATDSAEANVDPVISFGPGFDSTGYSLVESDGIGNEASTVPEPATWMLLSTAALGRGWTRRWRRHG